MVTRKASNANQYLQKVGHTWYARVRVPRTLEKRLRQTHLRESLKTGDLLEANRKKHAVVPKLKGQLAEEAKALAEGLPAREREPHLENPQAIREAFVELRAAGDEDTADALESAAVDKAE